MAGIHRITEAPQATRAMDRIQSNLVEQGRNPDKAESEQKKLQSEGALDREGKLKADLPPDTQRRLWREFSQILDRNEFMYRMAEKMQGGWNNDEFVAATNPKG